MTSGEGRQHQEQTCHWCGEAAEWPMVIDGRPFCSGACARDWIDVRPDGEEEE